MNEKTMTPIESMAALLAEMTERVIEAERQRDAAKDDADQWYHGYLRKTAELEEAKNRLAARTKEYEELRSAAEAHLEREKVRSAVDVYIEEEEMNRALEAYIEKFEKGAQENA